MTWRKLRLTHCKCPSVAYYAKHSLTYQACLCILVCVLYRLAYNARKNPAYSVRIVGRLIMWDWTRLTVREFRWIYNASFEVLIIILLSWKQRLLHFPINLAPTFLNLETETFSNFLGNNIYKDGAVPWKSVVAMWGLLETVSFLL